MELPQAFVLVLLNIFFIFCVKGDNSENIVEAGPSRVNKRAVPDSPINHTQYHDYDEIVAFYQNLAKKYSDRMDFHYFHNKTFEKRKMFWIRIHDPWTEAKRPVVMMEVGVHAREWVAPAATMWVVERLLTHLSLPGHRYMFSHDWIIIPLANPDGYTYSRTKPRNRMWRTNRRIYNHNNRLCVGVDLNRNFDAEWNTSGVHKDCRGQTFPGTKIASEVESRNIMELVDKYKENIVSYLSIHSFGQMLLTPWAFNVNTPFRYHKDMTDLGKKMAKEMKTPYGTEYKVGKTQELLNYSPSGTVNDWAQKTLPGAITFTYELRPKWGDPRHFKLAPDEIIPTAEEFYKSLEVLAQNALSRLGSHGNNLIK